MTGASCDNAFQVNSACYKVYNTDRVSWFTAVNRCRSNNASLAVFDRIRGLHIRLSHLCAVGQSVDWITEVTVDVAS